LGNREISGSFRRLGSIGVSRNIYKVLTVAKKKKKKKKAAHISRHNVILYFIRIFERSSSSSCVSTRVKQPTNSLRERERKREMRKKRGR
jgi:hypothetical protein